MNATFGSIVEMILYWTAIKDGGLSDLVQASITGSLLCTLLLLPGLSMIAGGIKYKEQRFNKQGFGVSNVLLIISVIGIFTPTIFYMAYGSYTLKCKQCLVPLNQTGVECAQCEYLEIDLDNDPVYTGGARPLMYAVSVVLPLAYIVGLIFTLKTHSYIFEKKQEGEGEEGKNSIYFF